MARRPKPWYWKERNIWCVNLDGKWHNLGKHPEGAAKPRKGKQGWNPPKVIQDAFNRLLDAPHSPPVQSDSVAAVLDDFLTWCYENRAQRTADRYKDFCQSFCDEHGRVPVSQLTTGHVTAWLNGKSTWNATTKHNAITALIRGFNWAVRNRGLDRNPIRGMDKPTPQKRTMVVTPDEFDEIIGNYDDGDRFRDLLIVSYDSGCRPFEIKELEARHVDLGKCRAVIPAEEAKKNIPRAFYFPTDRSMEIIKRLVEERPEGLLFVNARGTPWNGFNIRCRFQRLQKSGKVGKRYFHYAMRHSFVTRQLVAGVDIHTVGKLAGHQSTSMLDKHYSHIADDYEYMLKQARRGANAEGEE
jgi:site-specific recombinase XerD